MTLITDNQYLPSFILYKNLIEFSYTSLEQYESWQKMSFRNRCLIAGSDGTLSLSIPIAGGRNFTGLIREVKIDNSKGWQLLHWRSIISSYNRSPWFEFYKDEIQKFYNKKYVYLWDWNLDLFRWTLEKLNLELTISFTGEYKKDYSDEFLDLRDKIIPRTLDNFADKCPEYAQVFKERTGFIPNLSIIDLLFCEGKNAINLLKGS